ncbi:MAG: hypothetical protein O7D30_03370 [Rickettsia endosymbiont of Ixodes persulcatus]|nr:hypothetical protein [Rickettsia endosymbiont of Ixodes persulcatus]
MVASDVGSAMRRASNAPDSFARRTHCRKRPANDSTASANVMMTFALAVLKNVLKNEKKKLWGVNAPLKDTCKGKKLFFFKQPGWEKEVIKRIYNEK